MALTLVMLYVILSYVCIGVTIRVKSPLQGNCSFERELREDAAMCAFIFSPISILSILACLIFELANYSLSRILLKNPRPMDWGFLKLWE